MARRPIRELEAPAIKKCILPKEDGVGPLAGECREGRIDCAAGARIDDLRLKSYGCDRPLPPRARWFACKRKLD